MGHRHRSPARPLFTELTVTTASRVGCRRGLIIRQTPLAESALLSRAKFFISWWVLLI